jgi:hypothetical protein
MRRTATAMETETRTRTPVRVRLSLVLALSAPLPACGGASAPPPAAPAATAASPAAAAETAAAAALGSAATPTSTAAAPEAPPITHPDTPPRVLAGRWSLMPTPVTSFGAVTEGGFVYVLGGYHGTPHDYRPEGQSAAFWRMSLADGTWEALPGIPEGLQGLALVAHAGRVCRVGGMRVDAEGKLHSVAEAACFDTRSRQWSALPPLPEPRSSLDAVALDGRLYVVGGWTLDGDPAAGRFATTWLSLDLRRPGATWQVAEAPVARRGLAVAAPPGRVVAVGGMDASREPLARVDVLDARTGRWSRGPDFPGSPFGVAAVAVGDDVIAAGPDGALHRLRPRAERWEPAGALVFPRLFGRLVRGATPADAPQAARSPVKRAPGARSGSVSVAPAGFAQGAELLALGGIRGMTTDPRTVHVEPVSLRPATAPEVVLLELPYGGRAKNRQGLFVHGDAVHLFGGNVSLEQHDFEPEHFTREHHVLDLPSLRWTSAAPYPVARQTMQTVVLGEGRQARGVSVGGFGHDGSVARTHPESFAFDFRAGTWSSSAPDLPEPRSQFGLVRLAVPAAASAAADRDDALVVLGGLDYDPGRPARDRFRHVTPVLVARPGAPAFAPGGVELPEPRRAAGVAALEGRIYLVGGMAGEFQLVESCRVYDVAARTFAPIACPARTRLNPQLVALEEPGGARALYLVGGTSRQGDDLGPEPTVERYDPASDTWTTVLDRLPVEPRHVRAFAYRGRLAVLSTHTERPVAHLALVSVPALDQGARTASAAGRAPDPTPRRSASLSLQSGTSSRGQIGPSIGSASAASGSEMPPVLTNTKSRM